MAEIIFKAGDIFFDPVAAFYASWIGYMMQHVTQRHDVVDGRLRGFVIPQLKIEDDPIAGILRRQEAIPQLRFELDMSDPGDPIGTRGATSHLMEFWSQQMFGHAYESAYDAIEKRFGADRKKNWPPELQFAYHVRNGCFHGNQFNIRQGAISGLIPTEWRGRTIGYSENGTKLAGQFMGPADFITLLHDLKRLLS